MAFTVLPPSTDTTLRFGPVRTDIRWDGKSYALVSILPSCPDTSATYAVGVTQVAEREVRLFQAGTNLTATIRAGYPWQYATALSATATQENVFTLPHTVATNSVVQFELSAATSWTASASVVGNNTDLGYVDPLGLSHFTYEVIKASGTAAQVVSFGKITRMPPNPYSSNVSVAGNMPTATLCFG